MKLTSYRRHFYFVPSTSIWRWNRVTGDCFSLYLLAFTKKTASMKKIVYWTLFYYFTPILRCSLSLWYNFILYSFYLNFSNGNSTNSFRLSLRLYEEIWFYVHQKIQNDKLSFHQLLLFAGGQNDCRFI